MKALVMSGGGNDRSAGGPARWARTLFGFGALAALMACDSAAEPSSDARQAICPACVKRDVAGSETSDSALRVSSCTGDPAPVPTEGDAAALLREARDAYAGPFETTLVWGYPGLVDAGSPPAFWSEEPSGYEPVTRVSGDVALGEARFFQGRPRSGTTEVCPDWFEVPATVALITEDGAFDVIAEGSFVLGGGRAQRLYASVDLADVEGTLDLHLDPSFQYTAELGFAMAIYREGKRGNLWLAVDRLLGSPPARLDLDSSYTPLTGQFPDDACGGGGGFPSAPDAPLSAFDGRTPTQVLASWSESLEAAQPIPGVRYDCPFDGAPLYTASPVGVPIEVSFAIGPPELVCQTSASAVLGLPVGFGFRGPVRITTSDGLIDGPFGGGSVSGDVLSLVGIDGEEMPTQLFESRTGILGVNPGNSPWLKAFGLASFSRVQDRVLTDGFLVVEGVDCANPLGCVVTRHARVVWGVSSAEPEICNQ
jgi:hypothetical protein